MRSTIRGSAHRLIVPGTGRQSSRYFAEPIGFIPAGKIMKVGSCRLEYVSYSMSCALAWKKSNIACT